MLEKLDVYTCYIKLVKLCSQVLLHMYTVLSWSSWTCYTQYIYTLCQATSGHSGQLCDSPAIRDGKQNTFRHQIHELARSSKFWKLAKWGKSKANKTPDLSLVPDLETQEGTAKIFEEKTKAFSQQFFPKALVPEPSPESFQTVPEIQLFQKVTCEEVE